MELYHRPSTRFVAGFIGQPGMNFLPATIEAIDAGGIKARLADGSQISAEVDGGNTRVGDSVEIGIRPDDLAFGEGGDGFKISVRVVERLGATTIVYGSTGDGAPICASLGGLTKIAARDAIELSVDPASVHVFDADGKALPRRNSPSF